MDKEYGTAVALAARRRCSSSTRALVRCPWLKPSGQAITRGLHMHACNACR
jgi:hypothetical protein